jgi:hypothetical protein
MEDFCHFHRLFALFLHPINVRKHLFYILVDDLGHECQKTSFLHTCRLSWAQYTIIHIVLPDFNTSWPKRNLSPEIHCRFCIYRAKQCPPSKRKHLDIPQIMILIPIPHTQVIFLGQPTDGVLYCFLRRPHYLQSILSILCNIVSLGILNHLLTPSARLRVMNSNSNRLIKNTSNRNLQLIRYFLLQLVWIFHSIHLSGFLLTPPTRIPFPV